MFALATVAGELKTPKAGVTGAALPLVREEMGLNPAPFPNAEKLPPAAGANGVKEKPLKLLKAPPLSPWGRKVTKEKAQNVLKRIMIPASSHEWNNHTQLETVPTCNNMDLSVWISPQYHILYLFKSKTVFFIKTNQALLNTNNGKKKKSNNGSKLKGLDLTQRTKSLLHISFGWRLIINQENNHIHNSRTGSETVSQTQHFDYLCAKISTLGFLNSPVFHHFLTRNRKHSCLMGRIGENYRVRCGYWKCFCYKTK